MPACASQLPNCGLQAASRDGVTRPFCRKRMTCGVICFFLHPVRTRAGRPCSRDAVMLCAPPAGAPHPSGTCRRGICHLGVAWAWIIGGWRRARTLPVTDLWHATPVQPPCSPAFARPTTIHQVQRASRPTHDTHICPNAFTHALIVHNVVLQTAIARLQLRLALRLAPHHNLTKHLPRDTSAAPGEEVTRSGTQGPDPGVSTSL